MRFERMRCSLTAGRLFFVGFALTVCATATNNALAADSGKYSWVVVRSRHADLRGESNQIVADFATEDEAAADAKHRNETERDMAIIYFVLRRDDVGGREPTLTDRQGRPRRGLRDYNRNIQAAYDRARRASSYLRSYTGKLSPTAFDQINSQINDYNSAYDDALLAGNVPQGIARVPAVKRSDFKGELVAEGQVESAGKYEVWVYKLVNGRWAKQDDRSLATDNEGQARAYVAKIKSYRGWTATSNVPDPPAPASTAADDTSSELAGVWVAGDTQWEFRPDGTFKIAGGGRGRWTATSDGLAVRYSGASLWIRFKLSDGELIPQDGSRYRLSKR